MSSKRNRQKKSKAEIPPATKPSKAGVKKPPRPPLSRRRKWLFRMAAVILIPLLFFALLEAGLRLGGYGYPTTFYIGPNADGAYTVNNQFGWRFFPPAIARTPVASVIATKPAGAIRIFVLGSSAAQGVPNPAFSFGQILKVMLREHYPGEKFEVVNAAMTAINSHVVREISRDCAAFQPDLFIVYTGNNEVVGPFGPGTVFQQWSPSLKLIRANIWLKSTRTGQLLSNLMRGFHSGKELDSWRGMEMFQGNQVAVDDPRMTSVYDNFRRNLHDICGIGRRAGAGVILSTAAVNLRDCPPLASQHRADLPPEELAKWTSIYQLGVESEKKDEWKEAIAKYEAASRIDDRFADLQFRMGRCWAALDRNEKARECFIAARDYDALRFRADSKINAVIRETAVEQAASGVRLADAENALAASDLADGGIPGNNLFFEHVHLTFDGNYLLARSVFEQIEGALPQLAASRKDQPILTRQQCAESLALTAWDEYQSTALMTEVIARPPFTNQLDHAASVVSARERTDRLAKLATTPQAVQESRKIYEAALKKAPDDCALHHRYAKLALGLGERELAAEQLRIVAKLSPQESTLYLDMGLLARQMGRDREAVAHFQKALEKDTEIAVGHYQLALALIACGRKEEALNHYRRSLEIDAGSAIMHYNYAVALYSCKRIDEAIAQYEKALEIDPQMVTAHFNLGIILKETGRTNEAVSHAQKALEIDTGNAVVHDNFGVTLAESGWIKEAIAQYEKSLKIDPEYAIAHHHLGVALYDSGRVEEAIEQYQKALDINPKSAKTRYNLGVALADRGRNDEAIAQYQEAVKIDPKYSAAYLNMGSIFASRGRIDEAIPCFQKAVDADPKNAAAYHNLGKAFVLRGRLEEGIASFQEALRIQPNYGDARRDLQDALAKRDAGKARQRP